MTIAFYGRHFGKESKGCGAYAIHNKRDSFTSQEDLILALQLKFCKYAKNLRFSILKKKDGKNRPKINCVV